MKNKNKVEMQFGEGACPSSQQVTKPKKKSRFWRNFGIFMMGFVFAFIVLFGSLFGVGYYIYTGKNMEWFFNQAGSDINDYAGDDGEQDFKNMTLQQLIADINGINGGFGSLSLNQLEKRYGLKLKTTLNGVFPMPDALFDVSLNKLSTNEGIDFVINNTNFDYVFRVVPDAFSEAAQAQLKDKSFSLLTSGDIATLLTGVKVGAFTDAVYDSASNSFVVADPDNITLTEALNNTDLGEFYKNISGEKGDVMFAIKIALGDVKLVNVVTGIDEVLKDKKFESIFVTENGVTKIDVNKLFSDAYVGELMGYHAVKEGDKVISWLNKDNVELTEKMMICIANLSVNTLIDGSFSILDTFGGLYIGDVMNYVPVLDAENNVIGWQTQTGSDITGLTSAVASITMSDIISGEADILDSIGDVTFGEVMNLKLQDGKWVDIDTGDPATPLIAALADFKISELTGNNIENKIKTLKLSDIIDCGDKGMLFALRNSSLNSIGTDINNMAFGNVLGLYYQDGVWYTDEGCTAPATGLNKALADFTVNTLFQGIQDLKVSDFVDCGESGLLAAMADIKLSELGTEINNVKVGSMLGLFEKDGVWYTDSEFTQKATGMHAILADSTIGTLSGDIAGIKIGRVLGLFYNESDGKWYQDEKFTTLADGMQLAFADIALDEFDTNALKGAVNKLTVSDLFINADSGILSLIDENTTVQELPDALLNGLKTMNIDKALKLGVLEINEDFQDQLDLDERMSGWKAMNLTEFFNKLIELALKVH